MMDEHLVESSIRDVESSEHNPEFDEQRLKYKRDRAEREGHLFAYTLSLLQWLFIAGFTFTLFIVGSVVSGASPWLITLASVSLLIPAILAGYLIQHVFSKEKPNESEAASFIERLPAAEVAKMMLEIIPDSGKK